MKRRFARLRDYGAQVVAALLAFAAVSAASLAMAAPPTSCIEPLDPARLATGLNKAGDLPVSGSGNLAIIDFAGDYSRGATAARQRVAESYFRVYRDDVDFLIVFTTFEFVSGDARAFYTPIRNDVAGIGQPIFDHAQAFGSSSLQGYVDMAATTRWELNPRLTGFDTTLDLLGHELMHRYGVYLRWRDPAQTLRTDLLGRESVHWSYFVDSDASVMYGSDWRPLLGSAFEAIDVFHRYSDLDRYAAGWIGASDVRPTVLISGANGDPTSLPNRGARVQGLATPVTIEQVVAAEGARVPAADAAQRRYRAGWVLLRRPGETLPPEIVPLLEQTRRAFELRFAAMSQAQAQIAINNTERPTSSRGLPVVLTGSGASSAAASLPRAAAWLRLQQRADGRFADKPGSEFRDTAVAVRALEELDPGFAGLTQARAWLTSQTAVLLSSDARSWALRGLDADLAQLVGDSATSQRADGGWGLAAEFSSASLDSALTVGALAARNATGVDMARARQWLLASANSDGSYAAYLGGRGRALPTLWAAQALAGGDGVNLDPARAWLRARQRSDGGLGDAVSEPGLSARALLTPSTLGAQGLDAARLVQYLLLNQQLNGDWQGSVYTTAQAALALSRFGRPNLRFRGAINAQPSSAISGERVRLSADIENSGNGATTPFVVRWYRGAPQSGGSVLATQLIAGGLDAAAVTRISYDWDSSGSSGNTLIVAQLDADQVVDESSEVDNESTLNVAVGAPPVLPDLTMFADEVSIDPAALAVVPAVVHVRGRVHNLGTTDVTAVRLTLARSGVAAALAETSLAVPARGEVQFDLSYTQTLAEGSSLRLAIDPDDRVAEANENNNGLSLGLPLASAVDLVVTTADVELLTDPALVGEDVRWRVSVRNRGTSAAPSTALRATVIAAGERMALPEAAINIGSGQTIDRVFQWRADRAGPVQLELIADPANTVTETDETNNLAMFATTIGRPEQPDLVVDSGTLSAVPSPALEGAALLIRASLRNIGGSATGAFEARVYAGDPRSGAQALAQLTVAGLASTAASTVEVNLPVLALRGDQTIYLQVDAGGQIVERSENNNFALLPLRVLRLPDLQSSLAGLALTPSVPVPGQSLEFRITVRNLGEQSASASVVRVESGGNVVATVALGVLAPGASETAVASWIYSAPAGAAQLAVMVDAADSVHEGDEGNNRIELPLASQNPALYADYPVFSPNGDGVRDRARVALRFAGQANVAVELTYADGRLVRRWEAGQVGSAANAELLWDGRDARGRIVPDGSYRLRVLGSDGSGLGDLELGVDRDRASVLDAVGIGAGEMVDLERLYRSSEWRAPPDSSPWRMQLYTQMRWPADSAAPTGVYAVHPHDRDVRALVSGQWVQAQAAGALGADIVWFAFAPAGDAVIFELERRLATGDSEYTLWRAALDSVDAPQPIGNTSATTRSDYLGAYAAQQVALQRADQLWRLDLLTGTQTLLHSGVPPIAADAPIGAAGLLYADRYYPNDPARAPVSLPTSAPGANVVDTAQADGSHVLRLQTLADVIEVDLIDAASGSALHLRSIPRERAGVPGDPWNDVHSDGYGGAAAVASWVEQEQAFALFDGSVHTLELIATDGSPRAQFVLPGLTRLSPYQSDGLASVCDDPIPAVFNTTASTDAPIYNPWSQQFSLVHSEQAVARFYCHPQWVSTPGVSEQLTAGLADLSATVDARCESSESVQLTDPGDRERYRCPDDFGLPQAVLNDGSQISASGHVRNSAGLQTASPWSQSNRELRFVSAQGQVVLGSGYGMITQYLNLSARLRAVSNGRRIVLSGVAADRNLDYYELEWARAAQPDNWFALTVPERREVRNDEFIAWTPAEPGDYRFRLRVVDRAGNVALALARARSSDAGAVALESVAPRAFSPNGDGAQDNVVLRFRVLAPLSTEFEVRDAGGVRVRLEALTYGGADLGAQQIAWDGRDDAGQRLPDGVYRIGVDGQNFLVTLDTVAPQVRIEGNPWYRMQSPNYAVVATGLPDLAMGCFEERTPATPGCAQLQRQANLTAPIEDVAQVDQCESAQQLCARRATGDAGRERWRLVARDAAGNQTVSPWVGPQTPALVLHAVVAPADIDPSQSPLRVPYQSPPVDLNTPPDLGSPYSISQLQLMDGTQGSTELLLQARAAGGVGGWRTLTSSTVASARICSPYVASGCFERALQLPLDLSAEVAGSTLDLRVIARGGTGGDVESNRIRVSVPGLAAPVVWSPALGVPLAQTLFERMPAGVPGRVYNYIWVRSFLPGVPVDPRLVTPPPPGGSSGNVHDAVVAAVGGILFRTATCLASPQDLQARARVVQSEQRSPTARLYLAGQPEGTPCQAGSGPGSGGGNFTLTLHPVVSPTCDDAPSGRLRAVLHAESLSVGRQQLVRLSQLDASGAPITTLLELPRHDSSDPGFELNAEFATSALAIGQVRIQAQLIGSTATLTTQAWGVVDRTPPVVALTRPAPGGRICARNDLGGNPGVRVEGRVQEAGGYALALDWGLSEQPGSWYCAQGTPRSDLRRYCEPAAVSGSMLVSPQTAGPLFDWIEQPSLPSGLVSLRLRATDWSGAQVCSTSSFELDSRVDWVESQPPATLFDSVNRILGLAPQGAPDYRMARLHRRANEPLDVRTTLHAVTRTGNAFVVGANALGTLATNTGNAGEFSTDWDGRLAGAVVADGLYALRLHATDACAQDDQVDALVLVDNTAPQLAVSAPAPGANLDAAVISLRAGISDAHTGPWRVEFGEGSAPVSWTEVAHGSGDRAADSLLGVWPRGTAQGPGVLRFSADDTLGNRHVVLVPITLAARTRILDRAELLPTAFSPNADGRQDNTRLELVLARESRVSARVTTAQGTLVRELANNQAVATGPANWVWDGRDANGALAAEGDYRVEVIAADAAQPAQSESAQLQARLDLTPPQLNLTTPAGAHSRGGLAVWSVADPDLQQASARLRTQPDGVLWTEQTVEQAGEHVLRSLDDLADGNYRLEAQALDRAGNSASERRDFRLDAQAPELELLTPADDAVLARGGAPISVRARVFDTALQQWQLEIQAAGSPIWSLIGQGTDVVSSPAQLLTWTPTQPDGDYRLRLLARDLAGNETSVVRAISIDGTPPLVRIDSPASGTFVGATSAVLASCSDAHLLEYRLAWATPAQAAQGLWTDLAIGSDAIDHARIAELADLSIQGDVRLRLRALDAAGLSAEQTLAIRLDTEPPSAPAALTGVLLQNRDVRLAWTSPPGELAGYLLYRLGALITQLPALPTEYLDALVPEGRVRYQVRAVDLAGNHSAPSNTLELVVDRTPPLVLIVQPRAGERVRGVLHLLGSAYAEDDFERYELTAQAGAATQLLRTSTQALLGGEIGLLDTRSYSEGQTVRLQLNAQDVRANVASVSVEVQVDNQPPAAPSGLSVAEIGADVRAQWNANTEPDLLGYLLYRDEALINGPAALPEDLRPYALTAVEFLDVAVGDGQRAYRAYAIDTAGNVSAPSLPANLTLEHGAPQIAFTAPADGAEFETDILIQADSPDRDISEVRFEVRTGSGGFAPLGAPVTARPYQVLLRPAALGDYELRVSAQDAGGRISAEAPLLHVHKVDRTPPPRVTALDAHALGSQVNLSWPAVIATDLAGYRVDGRRLDDGTLWQSALLTSVSAVHPDAPAGHWRYTVTAVDEQGNAADPSPSDDAEVYAADLIVGRTPTDLPTIDAEGQSSAVGLVEVELSDSNGSQPRGPFPTDEHGAYALTLSGLAVGRSDLRLSVRNADGDRSGVLSARIDRGSLPAAPTGLIAAVNGSDVQLSWSTLGAGPGWRYRLWRDDGALPAAKPVVAPWTANAEPASAAQLAIDGDSQTAWDTPVVGPTLRGVYLAVQWPQAEFLSEVTVDFGDVAQRASAFDLQAWDGAQYVHIARVSDNAARVAIVSVDPPYRTDRIRIVPRRVPWTDYRSLTVAELGLVATPVLDASTFVDSPADGRHRYQIAAINELGLVGARSSVVPAAVGDVDAPDAPVLSGSVSGSSAQLSWSAAQAADVSVYRLYRDNALIASVAASASRSFADTGLRNGRYRYSVTAVDGVGNASDPSNVVQLDVDAQLPGTPELFTVAAPTRGGVLELRWQPGPGASPQRYQIHRAQAQAGPFAAIAEPGAASFDDAGLSNGTRYWYTVEAIDAAGNHSLPTLPVSGVPRDLEPPGAASISFPTTHGEPLAFERGSSDLCAFAADAVAVEWPPLGSAAGASTAVALDWRVRPLPSTLGTPDAPLLAASGRSAWFQSGSVERWVNLDDLSLRASPSGLQALAFNADGDAAYATRVDNGQLLRVTLANSQTETITTGLAEVTALRLSADERWWLLQGRIDPGGPMGIWWYERASATRTPLTGVDADQLDRASLAIDAAGARVMTRVGAELRLHMRTSATSELISNSATGVAPAMTLGGERVIFGAPAGSAEALWLHTAGSTDNQLWKRFAEPVSAVQWIGPEHLLVVVSGNVLLYRIDDSNAPIADYSGVNPRAIAPSGRMLLTDPGVASSVLDVPGSACQRVQALAPGSNLVRATALDSAGNRSLPSAAIQLVRPAGANADLAIAAAAIGFDPAAATPGQPVQARVTVRNAGAGAAAPSRLRATIVQGTSNLRSVDVDTPALGRGAASLLTMNLGSLPANGSYLLQFEADALGVVAESDESNNLAEREYLVSPAGSPLLELELLSANLAPGGELAGSVRVRNPGPAFSGRVEVRIEDLQGQLALALADESTGALATGASFRRDFATSTQALFAGGYQVRARLRAVGGALVAEELRTLDIESFRQFELALAATQASTPQGSPIDLVLRLRYRAGNVLVPGGQLRLHISALGGGPSIFEWQRALGTLEPGFEAQQTLRWPATGVAPGSYLAELEFVAGAASWQAQTLLTITPAQASATPTATVAGDPAPLVLGTTGTVVWTLQNPATSALTDLPTRVRVRRASDLSIVHEVLAPSSIPAQGTTSGTQPLATTSLAAEPLLASVEVQLPGAAPDTYTLLALRSIDVIDGLAPLITPLQPGAYAPSPLPIQAQVIDAHSTIERVEARLDSDEWRQLSGQGASRYGRTAVGLTEGPHQIRYRARDRWGNLAETAVRDFVVDATAPQITISGVTDGQLSRTALTPIIQISEAHPSTLTILLDGQSFTSGTSVSLEGPHELRVEAVDLAGNRSSARLGFVLDRTPPPISFSAPANGASVQTETVDVTLTSEAQAHIALSVGAWGAQVQADALGVAQFLAVPLLPGSNSLSARATDAAGNVSAPVAIQVTRADDPALVLVGAVQVALATLEPGTALQVSYSAQYTGSEPRLGQTLRMQARTASGQILASTERTRDLAVGSTFSEVLSYDTSVWGLGLVSFALDAGSSSGYVNLAVGSATFADQSPPQLSVLAPPADAVLRSPISVRASAQDALGSVSSVEMRIDGGAWSALTAAGADYQSAPLTVSEGGHTLTLRASDEAGNMLTLPAQAFSVDMSAPVINISGVLDGQLSRDPLVPLIQVSDPHPGTTTSTLNGVPFVSGTSISASGDYRLDVSASDALGNQSSARVDFRVDRDPPGLTFLQPANNAVILSERVSIEGQTEADASVLLTTASFSTLVAAGSDGRFLVADVPLQTGINLVQAQATDPAGNLGAPSTLSLEYRPNAGITLTGTLAITPDPAPHGGSVDVRADIHNPGATQARGLLLRLSAYASGASSPWAEREFNVTLAPGAETTEIWPLALTGQLLGNQRVLLAAFYTDAQGNQSWVPLREQSFVVSDQSAPVVSIQSPVAASILGARVLVEAQASDALTGIASVQARLGTGFWLPLAPVSGSPGRYSGYLDASSEGDVALQVAAVDGAGNRALAQPVTVRIDLTAPAIAITGVPTVPVNHAVTPVIQVTDASPLTVTLRLDGNAYTAGVPISAEGVHRLDVQARDAAGNLAEASASFTIDLTAPAVVIGYPTPGTRTKRSAIEALGSAEPGSSVRILAPGFAVAAPLNAQSEFGPLRVPLLVGDNPISAEATDAAGNIGRTGPIVVVREGASDRGLIGDLSGPAELTLSAPLLLNIQVQNLSDQNLPSLSLRVRALAGTTLLATDTRSATLAAGAFLRYDLTWPTSAWRSGRIDLLLERVDTSNVSVLDRYSLNALDRIPPTLSILTPGAGQAMGLGDLIRVRADDAHSAIASVEVRIDTDTWLAATADPADPGVYTLPLPRLSAGTHGLSARATDSAANTAQAGPVDFQARAILPLVVSEPADGAQLPPGPIDFVGTTQAQASVRVRRVDSTEERSATADASGRFRVSGVLLPEGEQRYLVQARNSAGDSSDVLTVRVIGFDPVRVPIPLIGPAAALLLLLLLIATARSGLEAAPGTSLRLPKRGGRR